jgi:hypothetical protein
MERINPFLPSIKAGAKTKSDKTAKTVNIFSVQCIVQFRGIRKLLELGLKVPNL